MELVREYGDVCQEVPGEAWGVMHRIRTPPGQVIHENWKQIPKQLQKQIKDELKMMLEKGIIQESRSDWRSPIVVVLKPDGKIRLCIDFRKGSALDKFDAYPMLRVDKMVENIEQASYISTLDRRKGYWQSIIQGPKVSTMPTTVVRVAQIVLGVMCVALGMALRFGPYTTVIWLQSPFWTGALFVGLGALCVLCRRHGTGCLLFLTACLALASVVGATVAVVCGGIEVVWSRGNTGTRCSKFSFDGSYTDGWTWWECQEVLQMKNLFLGIRVLLLVTTASALVIAACCLVCTCQILCCRTQDQAESTVGAEPLVISTPTAQAQPQPDKETCVDSA
ncbi:transmembrane protein 176B isoform A [Alligator mississippiensis]|uniref:Transmembrane protein 176B isoform A n=1 Tax=Alligator mississippiensis TaxID=8496 RepID=A0A151P697_ALLMI|nr:transmembrane protein 176B isoform A [Alligator mississippiensis]